MKMVEIQEGIGFGIKKTRVSFVFKNEQSWDAFVNSGWGAGAQATAAAKNGAAGAAYQGAISVSPGVWLYQLTDQGHKVLQGRRTKLKTSLKAAVF